MMEKSTSPVKLNNHNFQDLENKNLLPLEDKPLSFQKSPNGNMVPNPSLRKDQAFHSLKLTTGTDQPNLQKQLLIQATNATSILAPKEKIYNTTAESLFALGSKNELEGMLAVQLVSLHNQAMTSMGKSSTLLKEGGPSERLDKAINRTCKLLNTFYKGVQIREKIKNKEQKIRVEHIHINDGGQAIIGDVNK
ncbi:MAG: hypothetical protein COB02_09075 [Candidatus Cloacimonadota bacterium]|nr:MAG: hypothetical protein COB02_09075 [Candidatus Cloacimonadota bacterium]